MERLEPAWLPSEAEVGVGGAYSPTADVPSVQGRIRSSDGGSCEGFGEKRDNGAGLMLKEKMIIRGLGVNWLLPGCRLSLISHRTDAQRLQTPEQEQQKSRNSSGGPHSALPPPLRPLVRTLPPHPPRYSYFLTCCRCAALGSWSEGAMKQRIRRVETSKTNNKKSCGVLS